MDSTSAETVGESFEEYLEKMDTRRAVNIQNMKTFKASSITARPTAGGHIETAKDPKQAKICPLQGAFPERSIVIEAREEFILQAAGFYDFLTKQLHLTLSSSSYGFRVLTKRIFYHNKTIEENHKTDRQWRTLGTFDFSLVNVHVFYPSVAIAYEYEFQETSGSFIARLDTTVSEH